MRAVSRIHGISTKLRWYADEHSVFPGGAATNGSIDNLVSAGILSADDVAFLRDHKVNYYGFDLSHIAADVPVFAIVFTNTKASYHIISYSDGHTEVPDLPKKP